MVGTHVVSCDAKKCVYTGTGPQCYYYFVLIGRRIGPGECYLTYPGDKPVLFLVLHFFQRGWFLVAGW